MRLHLVALGISIWPVNGIAGVPGYAGEDLGMVCKKHILLLSPKDFQRTLVKWPPKQAYHDSA
jgi:hypothetical protein